MKIGIDATPLSVTRAGVGTYTANLLRALSRSEEDEVVPFLHRGVHPSFDEDLSGRELPSPDAFRWGANRTLWMQTRLRRRIRSEGFDICHFTNAVAPLRCPSPYVVTIHDTGLWRHPEYHYLLRLASIRPLVPHVVRHARAVVTVSRSVKDELVELLHVPEHRVRVVHQGVSPHFSVRPTADDLERTRRRYGLPDRFVLAVGALEPRKNLVRLLEAYEALSAEPEGRDLGMVIAGPEGWKSGPILATVARLEDRLPISLLGPVPDRALVSLYHLATVLAFPSLYEGFGLPVVEGMTCGTPVVTSRRGALAEISGGAAELVDPERVDSIAGGLLRVVGDDARAAALRGLGFERAREFTWDRAAEEIRNLYDEVTSGAVRSSRPRAAEDPTASRASERAVRHFGTSPIDLEEAILRSVAYADVFDYPLTADEIHRYLVGRAATTSEVQEALRDGALVPARLVRHGKYYALPGREHVVELRRQREAEADALWPRAVRYGRRLARLPFVRMVAVTGSLAASNTRPGADIDYLVVTAPGRLWVCRAFVVLLVRMAGLRGDELCPNYLLAESALELEETDLYTAWELAQAVPVAGIETYRRLRRRNGWVEAHLPNAADPPPSTWSDGRAAPQRGVAARLLETLLESPIGDRLERWERERKIRRLGRRGSVKVDEETLEAALGAERCKGHFGSTGREVLRRYHGRLDAFEPSGARSLPDA